MAASGNGTSDEKVRAAERLRDGLRGERTIYETIAELARRQDGVVANGATDELLDLARAKTRELERIEVLSTEIGPLKRMWPEIRADVSPALRGEVDAELESIEVVLRSLIELETRGQQKIENAQQSTVDHLRQVDSGRRLNRAYQTQARDPRKGT